MTRLRQLWLLTALGTLAALAGGYFLLVSPQAGKAAALREETETQLEMNRQIQSQIDMLNKQAKDLPQQQALLSRFTGLIPTNPAMPKLMRALSDAADNSGVELILVSPEVPTFSKGVNTQGVEVAGKVAAPDGQVLVTIPVKLRVVGEYSQMTSFFTELEEMNRAMLVSGFSIKRPERSLRKSAADGIDIVDPDLLVANITAQVMMTKKAPKAVTSATTATDADVTK